MIDESDLATMTEDEWSATAQGRATDNLIKTTIALGVVFAAAEVGSLLTNHLGSLAGFLNGVGRPAEQPHAEAQQKYLGMLDPELDQAVRSSLIVIGACSAIEAFIERFTKNRIREEPSMLDGTAFDAATLAQKTPTDDPEAIIEKQWYAIKYSPMRGVSPSKHPPLHERFEIMLKVVGRDGRTPPVIEHNVNAAYVVRNVWGHNAGYADATFISKAPDGFAFELGELVKLTQQDGTQYLHAMTTYGMIVANRERARHGLGPVPIEGRPGEAEFGHDYNTLYAQS